MHASISSLVAVLGAASAAVATSAHGAASFERRHGSSQHLQARITPDQAFQSKYYQQNYKNGDAAPDSRPGDSPDQTVIINNNNATDNNSPVSTCPIAYIGGAGVQGSEDDGWQSMAQVVGFDTKRLDVDTGITMPYYIEQKDYTKAQRIVMVLQGKPRDTWRYVNLMRYSGMCTVTKPDWQTQHEDYIVTAPIIWSTADLKAGGSAQTDLVWSGGSWATGGLTKGPGDASWTPFKAMDALVDQFFNTTLFPNVKSVVIAGHSAGAILAQRYAILREEVPGQDENMKWLIANAGAYAWPVDDRPIPNPPESKGCKTNAANCEMNAACEARKNQWPYGLDISDPSTMNIYARSRAEKDKAGLLKTYLNRRIQYTYSMLDDGPGDTHCEAQFQGATHYERGTNLQKALQSVGAPGASWTFVANATHVDEEVFVDPATQQWLFVDGLTDARNGSTDSTSSATKATNSGKSGKSGSGSGSTKSNGSTSSGSSSAAGNVQFHGAAYATLALSAVALIAATAVLL